MSAIKEAQIQGIGGTEEAKIWRVEVAFNEQHKGHFLQCQSADSAWYHFISFSVSQKGSL